MNYPSVFKQGQCVCIAVTPDETYILSYSKANNCYQISNRRYPYDKLDNIAYPNINLALDYISRDNILKNVITDVHFFESIAIYHGMKQDDIHAYADFMYKLRHLINDYLEILTV